MRKPVTAFTLNRNVSLSTLDAIVWLVFVQAGQELFLFLQTYLLASK